MRFNKYSVLALAGIAASTAIISAPTAQAVPAWEQTTHYVAFLEADVNRNSVRLTNTFHGGGVRCFDISSLTQEGGAYTTGYVVYDGSPVDIDFYSSNNCTDETMKRSNTFIAWDDEHKYTYVVTQ